MYQTNTMKFDVVLVHIEEAHSADAKASKHSNANPSM